MTSAAALAPEIHRRQALSSGAAAALAAAAPAWAVDSSAAIAVERSGFAPTIKQTGRTSRDTILGRPQRAARHLASIVAAAWTPSNDAAPLDAFEAAFSVEINQCAAFDATHGPGLVRRLVGTAGARRVALDGAQACLNRGAALAALAVLAALDAEVAPFSSPVRRFSAAGAAPPAPPPASSIFDDFAAAPQQPAAPPPPPQSSIFDGFDAAPQRQAPPSMLDGSLGTH